MNYISRLGIAFGISAALFGGLFPAAPRTSTYKISVPAIDAREFTDVIVPGIIASSTKCNGIYDMVVFIHPGGAMEPYSFDVPVYKEDVISMAEENGIDPFFVEFYNCRKPSKEKPPKNTLTV